MIEEGTRRIGGERAEVLKDAPLHYAPENELGVVFLFSDLAKKRRLRVEQIRPRFPDCIAYQKIGGAEKRIRIEFEFRSKNFKTQGHSAKDCDWIVCWEHNWPSVPEHLQVVELRREFGLGFNVWIQPIGEPFKGVISETKYGDCWCAPSRAHKGDLMLIYHNRPDKCIKDIFVLVGPVKYVRAGWKPGKDYMAPIRRVCSLKSPIFLSDLKHHQILQTSGFVRGNMLGRPIATEYWPYLYDLIVRRNPLIEDKLIKFAPYRLG